MASGTVIYSKDGVTISAAQTLKYEQRTQADKEKDGLGDATFNGIVQNDRLKSSSVDQQLYRAGASKPTKFRVMAKIEAAVAAKVSLAVTIPKGKELLFATIDGSNITTVKEIDTTKAGFEVIDIELEAGKTVYLVGQSTNPEVYGIKIDPVTSEG